MRIRNLFCVLTFLVLTHVSAGETPAVLGAAEFKATPEHPFGFRGDGTGRFTGATPPVEWSATKNVRWSVKVGRSYSSPVLTEKYVFVTSEPNLLLCINRADGKEVWKAETKLEDLPDQKDHDVAKEYAAPNPGSGMAAATPVTDGKFVYVVFANGIVRAFDLDGKPQWIAFISAEQSTSYGRSVSPILAAGKLIIHMTNLYAFDPATGKQLWMNNDAVSQYGSPAPFKQGDTDLLVTPVGDVFKTADGKKICSGIGTASHTSPVLSDGVIYFGEHAISAVKLSAALKDEEQWNYLIDGTVDVFGSPLIHNGLMFFATGMGELYVFDTKGKGAVQPLVKGNLLFGEPDDAMVYGSITLAGQNLYLNTIKGEMLVFEATKEAKPVAKNKIADGAGGSPVFSGKEMYIRDGESLFCIGQ